MKYALLADIHANLEAFEAVLRSIERVGVGAITVSGDLIGYYANPNECVQLAQKHKLHAVVGNHDRAGATGNPLLGSERAVRAMQWTQSRLSRSNAEYLARLPTTLRVGSQMLLFHGALHPEQNPENLHLENDADLRASLLKLPRHSEHPSIGIHGHTHRQRVVQLSASNEIFPLNETTGVLSLEADHRYLVNPGSVGQPRDGSRDAAWAIYDDESFTLSFMRTNYKRDNTLRKAARAGLVPGKATRIWRRLLRRRSG